MKKGIYIIDEKGNKVSLNLCLTTNSSPWALCSNFLAFVYYHFSCLKIDDCVIPIWMRNYYDYGQEHRKELKVLEKWFAEVVKSQLHKQTGLFVLDLEIPVKGWVKDEYHYGEGPDQMLIIR